MILFYYGIFFTLFWLAVMAFLLINRRRVGFLASEPASGKEGPAVVVVIAVRNEERDLAQALQSVCRLDYPSFRILLINDRSTDRTGSIMAEFAARYPRIEVLTISSLPPGWLGKNHALQQGYEATNEEWMLFTDADVVFAPDTLRKALAYAVRKDLDFLTVLPFVRSRSEWLNAYLATFVSMLEMRQQPWSVRNPRSNASLGVGAFNLVRRSAYERMGTHRAISLRPDDDLQLGKRVKASGGRCDALYGRGQIGLEWYGSVGEFIRGLMKNTFSVFGYNPLRVLLTGVLPLVLFFVLPLPVLLFFGGPVEWALAGVLLAAQVLLMSRHRGAYTRPLFALMIPAAGVLMAYIMIRSTWLTLRQKGVYWRDHFYPLADLKKQSR